MLHLYTIRDETEDRPPIPSPLRHNPCIKIEKTKISGSYEKFDRDCIRRPIISQVYTSTARQIVYPGYQINMYNKKKPIS